MTQPDAQSTLPTTSQVIEGLPWKWKAQGAIFLVGGLGFMFDAWDVALNGVLIPLLSTHWNLTLGQAAWIATANLLGMAVGAFVWGGIADRLGRRTAFSLTLLTFSIFTVLGVFSPNIWVFCIFRFIAGFGLGGCIPVDYALVGEFSPAKHRGRLLTAMDGWWPVGAALCAFVSAYLIQFFDWRALMIVMIIPAFLVFGVRLFVPESPRFLEAVGRHDEADQVVQRLVKATGSPVTRWRRAEIEPPPARSGLVALGGQLKELWMWNPRVTFTAWLLFSSVLVVYYAALIWLPQILRQRGLADQAAFLVTGQMTAVGIVGVVLAAVLVDVLGRKWLLAVSALSACVALIGFGWVLEGSQGTLSTPSIALILAFGVLIQVAIPVLYAFVSELYPTRMRGSGFGWASTSSRVATGLAPLLFSSILMPHVGLAGTFAIVGGGVVIACLFMARWTRETTSASLS